VAFPVQRNRFSDGLAKIICALKINFDLLIKLLIAILDVSDP